MDGITDFWDDGWWLLAAVGGMLLLPALVYLLRVCYERLAGEEVPPGAE